MAKKEWDSSADDEKKRKRVENEEKQKTTHNFYVVSYSRGRYSVDIDLLKLVRKLKELGFYRYDLPDGGGSQIVRIQENKIAVVDKNQVIDAFEDYINSIGECEWDVVTGKDSDGCEIWGSTTIFPDMILSRLYKNQDFLFGQTLDRLRPDKPIQILQDDKYTKYIFFRNCVVVVENVLQTENQNISAASNYKIINYCDLQGGYIWENSIIDMDFYWSDNLGDFEQFVQRICGLAYDYITEPFAFKYGVDEERMYSIMSLIGYLMHDNYDCDEQAVIFTDVNKEGLNAAGGTGKGLLGKALSHVLNRDPIKDKKMLAVPGKGFDAQKDTRYAAGNISTQLIHIEDLDSNFKKLEALYNDIADGATFRPLFQNPTYKKCKFMVSMNQAMRIETEGSDGRRVIIFELANFFNATRRPADYFGKRFWSKEWSAADWCEFYSFMCRCEIMYITHGIIKPKDINFTERAARKAVGSDDMWAYLEKTFSPCLLNSNVSSKWNKASLWAEFNTRYFGTYKSQKTFSEKVLIFLRHKHIRTGIYRDGKNDWFWLNPTPEEISGHSMEMKIK